MVSGGTTTVKTRQGEMRSCDLEMIDVPSNFVGSPYASLFKHLAQKGAYSRFKLPFSSFTFSFTFCFFEETNTYNTRCITLLVSTPTDPEITSQVPYLSASFDPLI